MAGAGSYPNEITYTLAGPIQVPEFPGTTPGAIDYSVTNPYNPSCAPAVVVAPNGCEVAFVFNDLVLPDVSPGLRAGLTGVPEVKTIRAILQDVGSQSFPAAIISAGASNPDWSKDGKYINFPYTVEQVVFPMRTAYLYKFNNAGSNAKLVALKTELDKFVASRYYDEQSCHCQSLPINQPWTESGAACTGGPDVGYNPADGECDVCACTASTAMGESENYCECLTSSGPSDPSDPAYPFTS
ncbi:hypothetical protein T492DRAFT_846954 [Pavlovales sp. CCMP2436]|nr:hypothetical protein T492DRAFT_846954 [Pavlovales sp. CCMP2436]|mmetsp:Transcript_38868/g.91261  ORF Transcript_38868/g.91261 Transcript_38868/m.91261 type:complete len:242 (-) Transcript_38868:331-1056(-)